MTSRNRCIRLYNGKYIPILGLGTYKANSPGIVEKAVMDAIDVGYRHFDCAWIYGNEDEIGNALLSKMEEGVVAREDLFITTKLWNNYHERDSVMDMLKQSLMALQLTYVDLYLIHWPIAFKEDAKTLPLSEGSAAYSDIDYVETWKGMEDCVLCGLARSIGLANFNTEQIDRILEHANIIPAVNQVEVNPYLNQKRLIQFCTERNIVVSGYCPLGVNELGGIPGFPEPTILDPQLDIIGRKYNKTATQVVLNYLISMGICIVPKSVSKLRIMEIFDIFDFSLSVEDIAYLDSMNKDVRLYSFSAFTDHKYYPFKLAY